MQNRNTNRSSKARVHWQHHIEAQAASGLTQSAYCREHQLNNKYFSLWKRKLRKAASDVQMIPTVVKTEAAAKKMPSDGSTNSGLLKLTFPTGVILEFAAPNESTFLSLRTHLAQLPC